MELGAVPKDSAAVPVEVSYCNRVLRHQLYLILERAYTPGAQLKLQVCVTNADSL